MLIEYLFYFEGRIFISIIIEEILNLSTDYPHIEVL